MAIDIKNDATLSTSLISVYLSDGSTLTSDLHGTNTLTNVNTVTEGAELKQGTTGQFTSANSEYLSSASSDFDVATNLSMAAWVYADTLGTNTVFVSKHGVGDDRKFNWYITSSGVITFNWQNVANSAASAVTADTTLSTDTTYHVGFSFDGDTVIFYLNGVADGGGSGVTGFPTGGASPLELGTRLVSSKYFDGRENQVVIWNKVAAAGEFSSLYNSGSGIPYASPTVQGISTIQGLSTITL